MKAYRIKVLTLWIVATIICTTGLNARKITVTGKVTDAKYGSAVTGCSILVKGTHTGTLSGVDGKYSINVEKGKTLVFSLVGFETQEFKTQDTVLNVSLTRKEEILLTVNVMEDMEEIKEDVALVGYSPVKKQIMSAPIMSIPPPPQMEVNTEEYNSKSENRFKFVTEAPLSTFSIDVDAAAYGNMRRFINQGKLPPADAIRTEEFINYFSYNYEKPAGKDPVKISAETGECPWNSQHRLVRIGLKAKEIADDKLPPSNLVFLIDVSGSMYGATRLELVKSSLKLLINNLRKQDRVAVVVYAGSAGEVLPSTSGSDRQKIREVLDNLAAGGSTAGGEGIRLAYKIAEKNFIKKGNNRIILCTDGDFNVGVSSQQELEKLIEEKRQSGVFLTVLGYGMGNYKDNKMQTLAEKGNGNHAYIDNLQEANKVLVSEFGGTVHAVAKDVKLQIEFNPSQVQAYRLIGYESRLLRDEDFNDDTKDAGEMGAGHRVTAFYEIVPTGVKFTGAGSVDSLKYQKTPKKELPVYTDSKELMTVKLRYKEPDGDTSRKIELAVTDAKNSSVSSDFRFAAAVAMFGQLLGNSAFRGDATFDKVISLAKTALDNDEQGYRREFVRLVEVANQLTIDN
ncbi:MAG: von Willebrand factor type A domain-containing protein [Prevotellaceae bacterium]|jgi:Ca-activated chloride channel family protein|nr:von Willebrand factor type A domain-containing protein [Prevotellaceae bacterium]